MQWHSVVAAISLTSEVLKNSTVILKSDSKTVVSYIKNEGGTRSQMLLKLIKDLLARTGSLNTPSYFPDHLPGMYCVEVDYLPRNRRCAE
ncbi:unnamed protein product [Pieris brassicae]|uniref:Uncharacterized protein n=1 Tax=Pieris brassicae TaxID=7116 RepID=A0A9P0TJX1_PIEBR|nr:unnamed protein product [Pieris brassicae]